MILKVALFTLALSTGLVTFAQENDSTKTKRIKVLPVPAFGYAPETKTYIGAVALFTLDLYQDSITRTSNAKIEFNYTWKKQIITEMQWNYFTRAEKWFTQGLLHFSKYPDFYYGIGTSMPDSTQISYESDRVKIDVNLLRSIKGNLFAGIGFRHYSYSAIRSEADLSAFPELYTRKNTGISATVLKDQRNNILTPTKGHYLKLLGEYNFSSIDYQRITLDARKYFHWGKKLPQVLSGRLYSNHVVGSAPYYDLSLIGGDLFVRGYFYGRFRADNLTTIQSELRTDLFWRIGLSVFGGYTMIYNQVSSLNSSNFKPNGGIGLRFMVDKNERTNLRFDYAVGQNGQSGFYVSFGESF